MNANGSRRSRPVRVDSVFFELVDRKPLAVCHDVNGSSEFVGCDLLDGCDMPRLAIHTRVSFDSSSNAHVSSPEKSGDVPLGEGAERLIRLESLGYRGDGGR